MSGHHWQELECPHCRIGMDMHPGEPNYPVEEDDTIKCRHCDKYFQIKTGTTLIEKSLGRIACETFGPHINWRKLNPEAKQVWENVAVAVASAIQRKTESARVFTDEEIVVLKQYVEYQRIKPIVDFGFTRNPRTFQIPQEPSHSRLIHEGSEDFMIGNTDPEPERG